VQPEYRDRVQQLPPGETASRTTRTVGQQNGQSQGDTTDQPNRVSCTKRGEHALPGSHQASTGSVPT
jgi:hypothetical protein